MTARVTVRRNLCCLNWKCVIYTPLNVRCTCLFATSNTACCRAFLQMPCMEFTHVICLCCCIRAGREPMPVNSRNALETQQQPGGFDEICLWTAEDVTAEDVTSLIRFPLDRLVGHSLRAQVRFHKRQIHASSVLLQLHRR